MMTSDQHEILKKLRYFDFIPKTDNTVLFRTLWHSPYYVYERSFDNLEQAIEYAKAVVLKCGGLWEVRGVDPTTGVMKYADTGCSLEVVCDPHLYMQFMRENTVGL